MTSGSRQRSSRICSRISRGFTYRLRRPRRDEAEGHVDSHENTKTRKRSIWFRGFVLSWLVIATALLIAQPPTGDYLVFVGSYTNPTPTTTSASKGIYSFAFDSKSGTLSPLGLAALSVNPVHL